MIVTKLTGGLGNQMFQYAAGRYLSLKCNEELYFDVEDYAKIKMHNGYELHNFFIQEKFFKKTIFDKVLLKFENVNRLFSKFSPTRLNYHKESKYFCFDERLTNLSGSVYLDGYWQSYRYLELIESQLNKDFEFRIPPVYFNRFLIKEIHEVNSVSVHVRRGDYLSNKIFSKVHNVLDVEYYVRAFEIIKREISDPFFFVFSDDIEWAKKKFEGYNSCTFVSNPEQSSIEDLRLMRACKHNIIANSSFSWWGAWLNPNPNKIVIAPKQWLKTDQESNSDLMPKEWIRI